MADGGYTFTTNWFDQTAGYWPHLVRLAKGLHGDSLTCVDAGTYEGRSAIYMLDHVVGPAGRVYVIDTFDDPAIAATFTANIARHPRRDQVEVITGDVVTALPALAERLGETVHFLYLDACKTALGNITSLYMGERMLALGGIMVVDDYLWHRTPDPRTSPRMGINAYSSMTLLCEEMAVPRSQAAFQKKLPNAHLVDLYEEGTAARAG
ncbi:MAG: hypothetical protein RLY86_362 [Pseudomonadota bacterium]|jgi:predicted O-methyltransferase YrrM